MRSVFKRCVQCDNKTPSCPICKEDETCSFQIMTCERCAFTTCVKKPLSAGSSNNSTAAGPIAGGVVGGLVVVALMVFLVWKFCIKKRRDVYGQEWQDDASGIEKSGMDQFAMDRDRRASTHTVASLASTVYTRASNVIQIAYIPGVTNRSIHSSPDLVPPVPPIPAAGGSSVNSPHITEDDQHFFLPSDLRNSTYSGYSNRSSMGARSMARSSVATTIYRNNAIVSALPAQTASRMKPVSVSVKSSSKNSPNISRSPTPPMPSLSPQQTLNTKSSIVGRVGVPKTVTVTRKNPNQIYELDGSGSERSVPFGAVPDRRANASPYSARSSNFDDASSDDEVSSPINAQRRLIRQSDATTIQDDSPVSPGATPRAFSKYNPDSPARRQETSLNQIIEEATRKASHDPQPGALGYGPAELSPFSDRNAAGTP